MLYIIIIIIIHVHKVTYFSYAWLTHMQTQPPQACMDTAVSSSSRFSSVTCILLMLNQYIENGENRLNTYVTIYH